MKHGDFPQHYQRAPSVFTSFPSYGCECRGLATFFASMGQDWLKGGEWHRPPNGIIRMGVKQNQTKHWGMGFIPPVSCEIGRWFILLPTLRHHLANSGFCRMDGWVSWSIYLLKLVIFHIYVNYFESIFQWTDRQAKNCATKTMMPPHHIRTSVTVLWLGVARTLKNGNI